MARVDHFAVCVRIEARVHQPVVPQVRVLRAVRVHLWPVRVRGRPGEPGQAGGGRGGRGGRLPGGPEVVLPAGDPVAAPVAAGPRDGGCPRHAALVHRDRRPLVRPVRVLLHVLRQVRLLQY